MRNFANGGSPGRTAPPWPSGAEPLLGKVRTVDAFQTLPRFRLCALSITTRAAGDLLDAKLTAIVQARDPEQEGRIRHFAESLGLIAPHIPQTDFLKYRYLVDIDGNSNSWSLLLKLLMGSCVLKTATELRQWYYADLRPWVHYIPIRPTFPSFWNGSSGVANMTGMRTISPRPGCGSPTKSYLASK